MKRIIFLLFALTVPLAAWAPPLMIGDVGWPKTNAISSGCTPIPGIVAHWPCDDGSGDAATDTSGNDFTLFLENAPLWVPAFIGDGLAFTNNTQYAYTYNGVEVAGLTNATLTGWVNTTNSFAFGFDDFSAHRFGIILESGVVYWLAENGGGGYSTCPFTPDGNWHFFAMTFDGTQSGWSRVNAYIDGVQQTLTGIGATPGGPGSPGTLDTEDNLGAFSLAYDARTIPFAIYSDLRIYNRTLSAGEISSLHHETSKTCP